MSRGRPVSKRTQRQREFAKEFGVTHKGQFGVVANSIAGEWLGRGIARSYNMLRKTAPSGSVQRGHRRWTSRLQEFSYFLEWYWALTDSGGLPSSEKRELREVLLRDPDDSVNLKLFAKLPVAMTYGDNPPPRVRQTLRSLLSEHSPVYLTLIGCEDMQWGLAWEIASAIERREFIKDQLCWNTTSGMAVHDLLAHSYIPQLREREGNVALAAWDKLEKRAIQMGSREQQEVQACVRVLSHLTLHAIGLLELNGLTRAMADCYWSWLVRGRLMGVLGDIEVVVSRTRVLSKKLEPNDRYFALAETRLVEAEAVFRSHLADSSLPDAVAEFDALAQLATYFLARISARGIVGPQGGMLRLCERSMQQGYARAGDLALEPVSEIPYCEKPAFVWKPKPVVNKGAGNKPAAPRYCPSCSEYYAESDRKLKNRLKNSGRGPLATMSNGPQEKVVAEFLVNAGAGTPEQALALLNRANSDLL